MSATPQAVGSLVIDEEVAGSRHVFVARQPGLGRRVLVKILRRDSLGNAGLVERFRREARMAARVSHPNVQQAYDLFAWQGDHYLVLEHVDGANLREWLERLGPPPPEAARCLALELARGVEALHAMGIVHADLCAESVQVGRWGEVKVAGLGQARGAGEADPQGHEVTASSAPEVAAGSAPDVRSDVYALARIAAELSKPRGLPRTLRRALHADPRRRPSIVEFRARLEREVAESSAAAARAQIAAWLVGGRAEARQVIADDPAPSRAGPGIARRAALAGVGAGLIAALVVGWDRRESLLPATAKIAEPTPPPPVDAAPPAAAAAAEHAPSGEPARVRFAVFPWGAIRIDGGEAILTPRAEPVELPAGPHRIEISHPTLGTELRQITLAAGERRTLRHVFDRTPVR